MGNQNKILEKCNKFVDNFNIDKDNIENTIKNFSDFYKETKNVILGEPDEKTISNSTICKIYKSIKLGTSFPPTKKIADWIDQQFIKNSNLKLLEKYHSPILNEAKILKGIAVQYNKELTDSNNFTKRYNEQDKKIEQICKSCGYSSYNNYCHFYNTNEASNQLSGKDKENAEKIEPEVEKLTKIDEELKKVEQSIEISKNNYDESKKNLNSLLEKVYSEYKNKRQSEKDKSKVLTTLHALKEELKKGGDKAKLKKSVEESGKAFKKHLFNATLFKTGKKMTDLSKKIK